MDSTFSAENLKLKPEQIKRLKPADTGVTKPKRRKREFIQITREQSDRLDKAKNFATEIVFRHLVSSTEVTRKGYPLTKCSS